MISPDQFKYSSVDRTALVATVPDADWAAKLTDWQRLIRFRDYEQFVGNKADYVARQLEWAGREAIEEERRRQNSQASEMQHVADVAKAARKLLNLLRAPNSYRNDYTTAYFGARELLGSRLATGQPLYKDDVIEELLTEIVDDEGFVNQCMKTWHASDHLHSKHHPGLELFVEQALVYWGVWTGSAATSGNNGGPAARFLCAAANPLIDFAQKSLGIMLRRGGRLDEQSAGQIIRNVQKSATRPVKGKNAE